MKKTFSLLLVICCALLITGCGKSSSVGKDATVEELLDAYIDAFITADEDKLLTIFPSYMEEDVKKYFNKTELEEQMVQLKEEYGDDYAITYKIDNTIKATDEQLANLNESLKGHYKNAVDASECYAYEGSFTYKGSKKTDQGDMKEVVYCKIDGSWKLIIT